MPAINTRHLLAGHGPRHVRAPLRTADVAQRIVASITLHAAQGVEREISEYTSNSEIHALVTQLMKRKEKEDA